MLTPEQLREAIIRFRDDFPAFARLLKIHTKNEGLKPLILNRAQLYVHARAEAQKKRTGKVRQIILKGRQQGMSTYVEARLFWLTRFNPGMQAYILTHQFGATINLFNMTKRYVMNLPDQLKPSISKMNGMELHFDKLNSGFKVSTAGSKGAGRSATAQLFHGSEFAFWENAHEHIAGALQVVADAPNTEIWLESTANGMQNIMYEYSMKAIANKFDFELTFVPWYWSPEYTKEALANPTLSDEELEYQSKYTLNHSQMYWRRSKIAELGIAKFRQEYPADVEEAFKAEAIGALWTREDFRHLDKIPESANIVRRGIGLDPAVTNNKSSDEVGIIVASIDDSNNVYVERDLTKKYSVGEWVRKCVDEYYKQDCSVLVGETNQGGDLIRESILKLDNTIHFKGDHVRKSPYARSEVVASLYKKGQVYHITGTNGTNNLQALEDAMVGWVPKDQYNEEGTLVAKEQHLPDRMSANNLIISELRDLKRSKKEFFVMLST